MSFVELNRCFVLIGKDQEPSLDIGRDWGRKVGGWLEWSDLREHQRVVLLAEASSGKSAEFRNQAARLSAEGHPAFCVRIEELADQGFKAALEPDAAKMFEQWRTRTGKGWFFLDSVDEARLNRKNFETALKRFARGLDPSLERARVFISCRVSDWKGREDRAAIQQLLPAWEQPVEKSPSDNKSSGLLDPIFKAKNRSPTLSNRQPERKPNELLIVQLVPLSTDQYRTLAGALGVNDLDSFVDGITRNGLDAFTERPGDLIDLADYWKSYGRFGTFAAMVEHSINYKLKEADTYRPDNESLSLQKAREGAERIAAALTLGKSFTLRAPGHDPDPSLASGALDPALILNEWTDAERNALLRRGVFAPSTYGRVRFHHRSTQEYLTAQWLHRLLQSNCPRPEVWNLIFADRYGVETVVPSLRPAAAWLAPRQPDFLEEIIRREPLILLRCGDPGSLSLEARKRLLATYAKRHAAAEIADDSLDNRGLWMFADHSLADTIRESWGANERADFRMALLRLIREGAIIACVDLARSVAVDETVGDYYRILAVQVLEACKDQEGLAAIAQVLTKAPAKVSSRLAPSCAKALFPGHLTTEQLLTLIAESQPARKYSTEGFPRALIEFYNACPDLSSRIRFAGGLAELCLAPPFVEDYQRVSARHFELAKSLEPIATRELQALGNGDPPDYLIRLLMVVERAEREHHSDAERVALCNLVQAKVPLQRKLFWADVDEHQRNSGDKDQAVRFWSMRFSFLPLWRFRVEDLSWLYDDLVHRSAEADQRIALSAIVAVLQNAGQLQAKVGDLRLLVRDSRTLMEDLETYIAPPAADTESRRMRSQLKAHNRRAAAREEQDKLSWLKFRDDLQKNPDQLRDPQCLGGWAAGVFRLWTLTRWLQGRTRAGNEKAPRDWRLLEEGFGRKVAEAYRDGMKRLWRATKPERPKRKEGGAVTVKYSTILAFGAVGLEAAEDPEWALRLSDGEAARAAQHGCLSEQGYPEWIEALIVFHPQVVLPVLIRCISQEWLSPPPGRSDFLSRYASPTFPVQPPVQQVLFQRLVGREPRDLAKLDYALRIVKNLHLDEAQMIKLVRFARRRFAQNAAAGRNDHALRYLALLLLLDVNRAIDDLATWLVGGDAQERQSRAEHTLGELFDRHDPITSSALDHASVPTLERFLRLAYFYIRPEQDIVHEGVYSPGVRDSAESARNLILRAILDRPGADAFRALRHVADDPEFALRAEQFRELAQGKAERDGEPPPWNEAEVVTFERQRTAAVKTGADLFRVVMSVLTDIQFQLTKDDVSSRPLLERANDEDEVKNWIVEQMKYRSRGRFNAYREAQVAQGNKPDVIVSSTAAQCEVGIEVKHGGMSWTPRQLEKALRQQLATDYLKPPTRRHGIFLVTHHGQRGWRNPKSNKPMTFEALIRWLEAIAKTLIENDSGPIEVKCFGIDASPSNE